VRYWTQCGLGVNDPILIKNHVDISPIKLMRQSENYGQIEEHSWDCQGLNCIVLSEKMKKSVKNFIESLAVTWQ